MTPAVDREGASRIPEEVVRALSSVALRTTDYCHIRRAITRALDDERERCAKAPVTFPPAFPTWNRLYRDGYTDGIYAVRDAIRALARQGTGGKVDA